MSSKKPDIDQLEKQQEKTLHDRQLELAKELIENDEKNQFWKTVEKIGKFLSQKNYGWKWWRRF